MCLNYIAYFSSSCQKLRNNGVKSSDACMFYICIYIFDAKCTIMYVLSYYEYKSFCIHCHLIRCNVQEKRIFNLQLLVEISLINYM